MAGYQNLNGFSGGELDNILFDHNWKATPQPISVSIPDSWGGTEEDGIYPPGTEIVNVGTEFTSAVAKTKSRYQPVGLTFTFSFRGQSIYSAVQSIAEKVSGSGTETKTTKTYFIPFVAMNNLTDSGEYHQYLLKITHIEGEGNASIHIKAVANLGRY